MKKCIFCDEDIQEKATICRFCDKKQDKRNFTIKSIVSYGILIAIVGVFIYWMAYPNDFRYIAEKIDCKNMVVEKMKNPESTEFFGDIDVSEHKVIEYTTRIVLSGKYRSKNGFGAMSVGYFVCDKLGDRGMMNAIVGSDELNAYKKGMDILGGSDSYTDKIKKINDMYGK